MATKKPAKTAKAVAAKKVAGQVLKLGDLVRILHYGGQKGRIVEFRGPLGPGGARIYRVRIRQTPSPTYIELREDQLELMPADG